MILITKLLAIYLAPRWAGKQPPHSLPGRDNDDLAVSNKKGRILLG